MACRPQAALLAYFTRVEGSATAGALLERALGSRAQTGCYKRVLPDVARYHMSEAIEAAAVAHLEDPDLEVVAGAAETLGLFGSAAAVEPLRARFERWHETWQGREDEVRYSDVRGPQPAQSMVEWRLVEALARGRAWLTTRETLEQLRGLCVTDGCRQQTTQWVARTGDAVINVTQLDEPNDSFVTIAQYDLSSLQALEEKLAQYPPGTTFTLNTGTLDPESVAIVTSRIRKVADAHGITVR
jgi:hypothetical protein